MVMNIGMVALTATAKLLMRQLAHAHSLAFVMTSRKMKLATLSSMITVKRFLRTHQASSGRMSMIMKTGV